MGTLSIRSTPQRGGERRGEADHPEAGCYPAAMDEKSRETWEVSLAALEQHRRVATIGA
jgi:hypothetical protein